VTLGRWGDLLLLLLGVEVRPQFRDLFVELGEEHLQVLGLDLPHEDLGLLVEVDHPRRRVVGFILEDLRYQLHVHDVILQHHDILLDNQFPHNQLLGVFLPVDELARIFSLAQELPLPLPVGRVHINPNLVIIHAHGLGLVEPEHLRRADQLLDHVL